MVDDGGAGARPELREVLARWGVDPTVAGDGRCDADRGDDTDRCDGYVVLVADPVTGALDAHGPYSGRAAVLDAEARRRELDAEQLSDVAVEVVRRHRPRRHA